MNQCLECFTTTRNPKFCSLSCGAKAQARGRKLIDRNRVCKNCKSKFEYSERSQKFCSRSCSAKVSNKARSGYKFDMCAHCGTNKVKRSASKYCSIECSGASKTQVVIAAWLENPSSGTTSQGLKSVIRRYLIELAGNTCSRCGWDEINPATGTCPLEIDHIDGNSYNNNLDNLRVLCPNCHSLTPTYRALNKNSKRVYRTNRQL